MAPIDLTVMARSSSVAQQRKQWVEQQINFKNQRDAAIWIAMLALEPTYLKCDYTFRSLLDKHILIFLHTPMKKDLGAIKTTYKLASQMLADSLERERHPGQDQFEAEFLRSVYMFESRMRSAIDFLIQLFGDVDRIKVSLFEKKHGSKETPVIPVPIAKHPAATYDISPGWERRTEEVTRIEDNYSLPYSTIHPNYKTQPELEWRKTIRECEKAFQKYADNFDEMRRGLAGDAVEKNAPTTMPMTINGEDSTEHQLQKEG